MSSSSSHPLAAALHADAATVESTDSRNARHSARTAVPSPAVFAEFVSSLAAADDIDEPASSVAGGAAHVAGDGSPAAH